MTRKIDEIEKIIRDHEKRISELEKAIFVGKVKPKGKQEFKGLSGGIEYLISKGVLRHSKISQRGSRRIENRRILLFGQVC